MVSVNQLKKIYQPEEGDSFDDQTFLAEYIDNLLNGSKFIFFDYSMKTCFLNGSLRYALIFSLISSFRHKFQYMLVVKFFDLGRFLLKNTSIRITLWLLGTPKSVTFASFTN